MVVAVVDIEIRYSYTMHFSTRVVLCVVTQMGGHSKKATYYHQASSWFVSFFILGSCQVPERALVNRTAADLV